MDVVAQHFWLGEVRRCGEGQLLATIDIDPAIRPARLNGETDAEVLIAASSTLSDSALDDILAEVAGRIQFALANLDAIRAFALAHAPSDLHYDFPEVAETALDERLFLEGFEVTSSADMEVSFDFGDSDTLVVEVDRQGRGLSVRADR